MFRTHKFYDPTIKLVRGGVRTNAPPITIVDPYDNLKI